MAKFRLVFWEPIVSPHKAALFAALSEHPDVASVDVIAQTDMPPDRQALGWSVRVPRSVAVEIAPDAKRVDAVVRSSDRDAVHVFSGLRHVPVICDGLAAVRKHGRRFGLLSEPRVGEGLAGFARYLQSWLTEATLRARVDFVLGIGRHGPPWFRSVGYPAAKLFLFAYFLPDVSGSLDRETMPGERPEMRAVAYCGRLEREKGFDAFLEAIGRVRNPISVDILGTGSRATAAERLAATSAVPVRYHGVVPIGDVPGHLARSDILVLPSLTTDDGWGAVVSEALLVGTAVVVSGKAGSSVCIDGNAERGLVLAHVDGGTIAHAIDSLIDGTALDGAHRARRSAWARGHLTGTAGAEYLVSILHHIYDGAPRPAPLL